MISESGSLVNHLLLQLPFFLSFVPFMSFLFRLFRNRLRAGRLSGAAGILRPETRTAHLARLAERALQLEP